LVSNFALAPAGLAGKEGSHTAGNSPDVNDDAGALVVSFKDWPRRATREAPLAGIVAHAQSAIDCAYLANITCNGRPEGA
jgi:acetyl-CoA C-acetyltransferase